MNRLEANREILKVLTEVVEAWPDQRFGQLISNLDLIQRKENSEIINPFFTESTKTLAAIEAAVKRYKIKQMKLKDCESQDDFNAYYVSFYERLVIRCLKQKKFDSMGEEEKAVAGASIVKQILNKKLQKPWKGLNK